MGENKQVEGEGTHHVGVVEGLVERLDAGGKRRVVASGVQLVLMQLAVVLPDSHSTTVPQASLPLHATRYTIQSSAQSCVQLTIVTKRLSELRYFDGLVGAIYAPKVSTPTVNSVMLMDQSSDTAMRALKRTLNVHDWGCAS